MREDQFIQKIKAAMGTLPHTDGKKILGIGDDAALWRPKTGHEAILTCDWFLEGSHFLRDKHPADSVGWKCLARATSDIAAMGGNPVCFLMSLALPSSLSSRWLAEFLAGLRRAAKRLGCPLAGGDTTRREQILINITVVGEVPAGEAVLRSGARPSDMLFVSGRLGEAEAGLWFLRHARQSLSDARPLLRKHLYPEPRLAVGRWLARERLVSAMMDVSDGLSTDLPRLCRASKVGARLHASKIPQPRIPRLPKGRTLDSLDLALHGGDDYELLFAVSPRNFKRIPASFRGLPLTPIGEITRSSSVLVRDEDGRQALLVNQGWDPFRDRDE